MNENVENKSSRLIAILDSLSRKIESLKNNQQNSNNLSEYERQKKEILSKIEFVERCINIGIIKYILQAFPHKHVQKEKNL